MPDDAVIKKRTIAEEVADNLRLRILSGRLKGGAPIRQEHIAKELGISRIPLREALKQLEAEGFVAITAHKGAIVAPQSLTEIEELFELRLRLELWLLAEALPKLGEKDLAELDALITESRKKENFARWGELNWRLHETLYRAAGRPATLKILKRIHDRIDRYLRLEAAVSAEGRQRGYREHEELVALCRAGSGSAALGLLERHIRATAKNLTLALSGHAF